MVDDFDWTELLGLRAVQPLPHRPPGREGGHALLRLEDLLHLADEAGTARGRAVAVCPELKHPGLFQARGIDTIGAFVALVERHPARALVAAVLSFDLAPLARVQEALGIPVVAELEYPDAQAVGRGAFAWPALAARFSGISVDKRALLADAEGARRVSEAHAHGLSVYAWTFRDDRPGPGFRDGAAEYEAAFALGIDHVFSDFPDQALAARARHAA